MEPQGLQTRRLMRRAFQIEAVQVGPHNEAAVAEWCGGEIHATPPEQGLKRYIKVDVPGAKSKRQTMAFHGDWVLSNGIGWKVYTTEALWRDFEVLVEEQCGEHRWTADGKPCVLGAAHRHQAALIGCRSLQDYLVVNQDYTKNLAQEVVKTDQFDRTGGINMRAVTNVMGDAFNGGAHDDGPNRQRSCA